MELKVKMFEPVLEEKSFQSHLYGIESNMGAPYKVGGGGFNRTFMELKGQHRGTRNGAKGRFNRTFMELKVAMMGGHYQQQKFQSHLYGIESY